MKYPEFQRKVGQKIKSFRESTGITQEDMEFMDHDLQLTVRAYQEIERGKSNVTLKSLFIIARQLGIEPKDLLDV
ncbi:MAG TPA: helix-turn-helix transcriptional regulator [Leptospiraceae bacterium]|nr:helix-turn-helix domain-containing protein [Leptospirales bacterium]HMW59303.1 helix-turn-helix transcriptional regulator [Leptospiraceae bacterium]HMY45917.1 helix-turn-helix transcriptional regulator [Leptospiraceae bacterium]HNN60365.1 helix-turn-helix transcriptional regulator [Leptospiraceae bacterium]HNN75323.1 helix-turn-helix transcriptional regulator [Leptospiraceae bacterium]